MSIDYQNVSITDRAETANAVADKPDFHVNNLLREGRSLSDNHANTRKPDSGELDFGTSEGLYQNNKLSGSDSTAVNTIRREGTESPGSENLLENRSGNVLEIDYKLYHGSQHNRPGRFIKPGREEEARLLENVNETQTEYLNTQEDTFDRLDLNDSGKISHAELAVEIASNIMKGDSNEDSQIDFREFDKLLDGANPNQEFIAKIGFILSDRNRDGKLDTQEVQGLANGFASINMAIADRNRDGLLDRRELAPFLPDERPKPPIDKPGYNPGDKPSDKPGDIPSDKPGDKPYNPGDKPLDPIDKPPPNDEVPRASMEQVEQVMQQVENRGVSDRYMQELRESMAALPASVVQAAIDGRTRIVAVGQGQPGLGGSYNSGTNTVTMYESSPFDTKATLACEMFHNWDLNPYVGEHVSSKPWFRDAYQRALESGIRTGDNTLNNVYEFIHNMARYHTGYRGGVDSQIMAYLGPDYENSTTEALMA